MKLKTRNINKPINVKILHVDNNVTYYGIGIHVAGQNY